MQNEKPKQNSEWKDYRIPKEKSPASKDKKTEYEETGIKYKLEDGEEDLEPFYNEGDLSPYVEEKDGAKISHEEMKYKVHPTTKVERFEDKKKAEIEAAKKRIAELKKGFSVTISNTEDDAELDEELNSDIDRSIKEQAYAEQRKTELKKGKSVTIDAEPLDDDEGYFAS